MQNTIVVINKREGKPHWPRDAIILHLSCRIIWIIPLGAGASAINRGVWWCCGGSDDSDACCVPANLACNLCHMSSRLPPIFPVCLYCQLPKTAETRRESAKSFKPCRKAVNNFLHPSTLQLIFQSFTYLWGTTLTVRQTSRKRAVEEQEIHLLPPSSPSGHSKFYIPLLISITITVIRQHARHEVDDPVKQV